jgi:hypothetical protein
MSDPVDQAIGLISQASASPQFLNSGWRPAIGWICVFGFALMPFQQLLSMVLAACHSTVVLPNASISIYIELLGALGLGTLRTVEKLNNVHNDH